MKTLDVTNLKSGHARKLVEEIIEACEENGWESDCGSDENAKEALQRKNQAVHALVTYLNRLENIRKEYTKPNYHQSAQPMRSYAQTYAR